MKVKLLILFCILSFKTTAKSTDRNHIDSKSSSINCAIEPSFTGALFALLGDTLTFINTSVNATSYEWRLNGVSLGNTTNLTYVFDVAGNHELQLHAYNSSCCPYVAKNILVIDPENTNTDFCQSKFVPYGGDSGAQDLVRDSIFFAWNIFWGGEVYRHNLVSDQSSTISSAPFDPFVNGPYRVWEDRKGTVWIARRGDILEKFEVDSTRTTYSHPYLQNTYLNAFEEDIIGHIWIATENGVVAFDGINYWIGLFSSGNSSLPDDTVYDIKADSKGNVWFATAGGIAKFSIADFSYLYSGTFLTTNYTTANTALPSNRVHTIAEDPDGNIWFGTDAGLVKYDSVFTTYAYTVALPTYYEPYFYPTNSVHSSIDIDSRGNIWYSTSGALIKFDGVSNWEEYHEAYNGYGYIPFYFKGKDMHNYVRGAMGGGRAHFVPDITPAFRVQNTFCPEDPVLFINESLESVEHEWFIDGQKISEEENLMHTFENSGQYRLSLIARNFDCSEFLEKIISIPARAEELNLPPFATLCGNDSTALDAQLYTYASYSWSYQNDSSSIDSIGNQATLYAGQPGDYILTVRDSCGNTASDTITVIPALETIPVPLNLKIYLEGAYNATAGLMDNNIGVQDLPLVDPYLGQDSLAPSVFLIQDTNAVVDWVLIELRENPTSGAVFVRAALLQRDGDVVDNDGISPLMVPSGSYHVVIRHRNHLAAMSAQAVAINSCNTSIDFTRNPAYGTEGTKLLSNGFYALYSGDLVRDGWVDSNDRSAAWNKRNQQGYLDADCNLDGTVDSADRSIAWNNRNNQSQVP